MRHDELLAKLVITEKDGQNIYVPLRRYQVALRAVVELHKPAKHGYEDGSRECLNCGEIYPCSTIEAIEKALS